MAELDADREGSAPASDSALVERARRGDTEAFRELVERHRDRAFGLAVRMLRSATDAEEVTQDAFVRAWLALPRFRGEAAFGTWLHAIVVRRALDRAATLRRRRDREAPAEAASDAVAPRGGDEGHMRRALRMERLVSSLGEAQRTVVTLYYYEGHSVDEVAHMLGMPTGTVKTHLSRARGALREAWLRAEEADR